MDTLTNDIVIRFASYLRPLDLVNLSLTCGRFAATQLERRLQRVGITLVEDAARHRNSLSQTQEERNVLPRKTRQSYIEPYSELESFREPRVFDQLIGLAIYRTPYVL